MRDVTKNQEYVLAALGRATAWAKENTAESVFVIVTNASHKSVQVSLGTDLPYTTMLGAMSVEQHRMCTEAVDAENNQECGE